MARPLLKLDWEMIAKLCGLHCTQEEIASFCDCSLDTIERDCRRRFKTNFAEFYRQKRGLGRVSIRRKQYELATSGDKTMLIWLGKQWLGQSEKIEQQHEVQVSRPLKDLSDEDLAAALVEKAENE